MIGRYTDKWKNRYLYVFLMFWNNFHQLFLFFLVLQSHIVEPRSNGPTFNGIPPMTNTVSWSFEPIFFYFQYWLWQNSLVLGPWSLVPWNLMERDLTVHTIDKIVSCHEDNGWCVHRFVTPSSVTSPVSTLSALMGFNGTSLARMSCWLF